MFLASLVIIAQVYSCGSYGAAAYGQCTPASQTGTSSVNSQAVAPTGSASPTAARPSATSSSDASPVQQVANDLVHIDYLTLFCASLALAAAITGTMWLMRRRRHKTAEA